MEHERYTIPPYGDGTGSDSGSVGETTVATHASTDFQDEVNEKLDAILAALGVSQEVAR